MDYEEAFVREVRANPKDDVPRLIYADYLEEQGNPQGEFIRVQCELARMSPLDPARSALIEVEQRLLTDYAEEWLAPLRELGAKGVSRRSFHKGMIERVKLAAADFVMHGEDLCQLAPGVHIVQLTHVTDEVNRLAEMSMPAQIRMLDLSVNQLTIDQMQPISNAEWTSQIEELNLQFNRLGNTGLTPFAQGNWDRLRILALGMNQIEPRGLNPLRNAHWLRSLRSLFLNVNQLQNKGCKLLAETDQLSELRVLNLSSNGIKAGGAEALAASENLISLESLNLRGNLIEERGLRAFLEPTCALHHLTALDLLNNTARDYRSPERAARFDEQLNQIRERYPGEVPHPGLSE